ncbi:hypothetical protein [Streptomyces sp. NPDC059604]|uniref:hypothetical protein n=1 Tax=Streptomyces sp. NPDC059604 TaxID=3346881 RepID=UPI00369ECE54
MPRAKSPGEHDGHSRAPQAQHSPHEVEQFEAQLVEQVRPYVAELLLRDGNEVVTRVQLREILRREGLKGGRNAQLGRVLKKLRSTDTTKVRSATR